MQESSGDIIIALNKSWRYNITLGIGINDDGEDTKKDVFKLVRNDIPHEESIYASDNMLEAKAYRVEILDDTIVVPLGIIKRAIKYQEIAEKGNIAQYLFTNQT